MPSGIEVQDHLEQVVETVPPIEQLSSLARVEVLNPDRASPVTHDISELVEIHWPDVLRVETLLPSADIKNEIAAPSSVSGLRIGAIGFTFIEIAWDPNSATNIAGYHVYRDGAATPSEGSEPIIGSNFIDRGVTPGGTHAYRVSAYDTNGNESSLSDPISASASVDQTAPSQPQNLQVQLI